MYDNPHVIGEREREKWLLREYHLTANLLRDFHTVLHTALHPLRKQHQRKNVSYLTSELAVTLSEALTGLFFLFFQTWHTARTHINQQV